MRADLIATDAGSTAPDPLTTRDFALLQPSEAFDPLHRPVRGGLAHIRCAGRVFVPHYAVPMAHRVVGDGVALTATDRRGGTLLAMLPAGAVFNVLDLAGGWAWGQVGEDGLVGYVPAVALGPA